jgi:threonine dehydratase
MMVSHGVTWQGALPGCRAFFMQDDCQEMTALDLPNYQDVIRASAVLDGVVNRTPVLRSPLADARAGAQLFFKCENFQRTGAFKFRGAYYAIARLSEEQRRAGVVAYSSGNHAQAVALAARLLGTHAVILMPADAPMAKRAATEGYGGQVLTYDRYRDDRIAMAEAFVRDEGRVLLSPYDHADVIAGQGTAALELLQDQTDLDLLVTPIGGGGLISGSALALRALRPGARLIGVEPALGNDAQQSLRSGVLHHITAPRTIADGATTTHLGDRTFAILCRDVDDVVTVTDEELRETLVFLAQRLKLIVEPTGCLGAAALLHGKIALRPGQRAAAILSGGNVDMTALAGYLAAA